MSGRWTLLIPAVLCDVSVKCGEEEGGEWALEEGAKRVWRREDDRGYNGITREVVFSINSLFTNESINSQSESIRKQE
jgi:hypothetical protein